MHRLKVMLAEAVYECRTFLSCFLKFPAEELRFASYYGNHMVLQKAPAKAVVWGYGETGAKIVLSLSGSHNDYTTATRVVNGKVFTRI